MDAGPSYSYQHDLKNAIPVITEGKQMCMVRPYYLLLCNYGN